LKAWPRGLRSLRSSFASLGMTTLESSAKEIHLCEVNQFVAAPIDHSIKQEQTEQFHFFRVLSRHVLFLSFCMFQ
jgi:hypothetical protein